MTLVQIYTIIALLISFNVPPAVVSQVQNVLEPAVTMASASALEGLPVEPIDTVIVANEIPSSAVNIHGTVNFWADLLVRENNMTNGTTVTYSIDGTVVASSNGTADDYLLAVDTTKYTNGTHEVSIVATDANGNAVSSVFQADIEN